MTSHHTRFRDCPWYQENYDKVTIGGVGGIGSWLSFFLGRIGVPMDIYEMDSIDYTNMGGQLFRTDSIGLHKTAGVMRNLAEYSNFSNVNVFGEFKEGSLIQPITFSCFDNMKARELMVDGWYKDHGKMEKLSVPTIFIDGRMTVESFQIFAVTPDRYEEYRDRFIFDDNRVQDPICSMKSTSHIGGMIGSMMTQLFTNYMTNRLTGLDIREIPLQKCYETAFMDFI